MAAGGFSGAVGRRVPGRRKRKRGGVGCRTPVPRLCGGKGRADCAFGKGFAGRPMVGGSGIPAVSERRRARRKESACRNQCGRPFRFAGLAGLLLGYEHEIAADLLLVEGLVYIETLDLRFVARFYDLDFDLHVARVFVGESQDVERTRLLVGRGHRMGLVGILHHGGNARQHAVEHVCALRVGVDRPADARLFEGGCSRIVAADRLFGRPFADGRVLRVGGGVSR